LANGFFLISDPKGKHVPKCFFSFICHTTEQLDVVCLMVDSSNMLCTLKILFATLQQHQDFI